MLSTRTLYFLGGLFVVIAAILTVRELRLGIGYSVGLLLVALMLAAFFLKNARRVAALMVFTAATVVPSAAYLALAARKDWLVAITVAAVASALLVLRFRSVWLAFDLHDSSKQTLNLEGGALWTGLTLSSLGFFWSYYFHFLTALNDQFVARRLIFTLFLILLGIVLSTLGRNRPQPFLSLVGLTYLGIGVAKALLYDTTHLTGFLRIAVFAGGGLLLLVGGALMRKPSHA